MRIRLLGGLEVISSEGQPVRFATRKSALLFAALVLAGRRGHLREQLAEAFWPGRSETQARGSPAAGTPVDLGDYFRPTPMPPSSQKGIRKG